MIEIYKNFVLQTVDPDYSKFMWRRSFSKVGEFKLETFFTPEKFLFFEPDNVIFKRDVSEACVIEKRSVLQTIEGNLILVVSGRSLTSLFDRRVFTLNGNFTLQNFITNIVNNNFLVTGSRKIDNMNLLNFSFSDGNVTANYKNFNCLDGIIKVLEENQKGVKVEYNIKNKTFDIKFYHSNQTAVVFSRNFANIIEQDYMDDKSKYKNVVYSDTGIHNNEITGIERREMYSSDNPIDVLLDNKHLKTLQNVINPYSEQYKYLTDWDLGSVVLAESKNLSYKEYELITEVTEFYDEKGKNLEVTLGDVRR